MKSPGTAPQDDNGSAGLQSGRDLNKIFQAAVRPWDLAFALAIVLAFAALFFARSPFCALPGASASVALAAGGYGATGSLHEVPAVVATRVFRFFSSSSGAALASSSAVFSAMSLGVFYLLLLTLLHSFVRPGVMRDDIRGGAFQAWVLPRAGALLGVAALGLSPAAARLSAGEVPGAPVVFALTAAMALILHARITDNLTALVAGSALAGFGLGVHPLLIPALPFFAVPVLLASFETESDGNPLARLGLCIAAGAAGGAISAATAAAFCRASCAAIGQNAELESFSSILWAHASAAVKTTLSSDSIFGLEKGSTKFVLFFTVLPFVVTMLTANSSLSERDSARALHLFNAAVFIESAVALFGGSVSPLSFVEETAIEPVAAAISALSLVCAATGIYVQILYAFEEEQFPPPPPSRFITGKILRVSVLAICCATSVAIFASAVTRAPGASASLWKMLADATLESAGERRNIIRAPNDLAPLVKLAAYEHGRIVSTVPVNISAFRLSQDPALVALESDPGEWQDAGCSFEIAPVLFGGTGSETPQSAASDTFETWNAAAHSFEIPFRKAARGGKTAARAAEILSRAIVATGGELARKLAEAGDRQRALEVVIEARRYNPLSPMLSLDAVSLLAEAAGSHDIETLAAATSRGGSANGGFSELARVSCRPLDPACDAFLVPGLMRAGRPDRALAALSRARKAFAESNDKTNQAAIAEIAGRVRLLVGDRAGARECFEVAITTSPDTAAIAALALELFFSGSHPTDEAASSHLSALETLGASSIALLAARLRTIEDAGRPVSARMVLDKAIRDDAENATLLMMRFERNLDAMAAAANPDDLRRRRSAASEDLDKLRSAPGVWSMRLALDAARMWLIDDEIGLARSELAAAALAFPDEPRILRPLIRLDGAIGLAASKLDHFEALCRVTPALASDAAEKGTDAVLATFPDTPPDESALLPTTLEEDLFATFPANHRESEFKAAAALACRDIHALADATARSFASAAASENVRPMFSIP